MSARARGGLASARAAPGSRAALSVAFFLVVSTGWSWPLLLEPGRVFVGGVDTWGSAWLAGTAAYHDRFLHTFLAAWPEGQDLRRADSLLFLALARAWPFSPVLYANLHVLLGPVLSAWAAERLAARLGAPWPWTLLAGLAHGFGGAAAAAMLEGQVYLLLDPWVPLCAGAWWTATGPGGRARDGLLAGTGFALALATSAYAGIVAALAVLVLGGVRLVADGLPRVAPLAAAAAVALPTGAAVAALFATGSLRAAGSDPALSPGGAMAVGSVSLASLVTVVPGGAGGEAAPIGATVLALAAVAPVVLARRRGWRAWALLGLAGAILALGPVLQLDPAAGLGLPGPLRPLAMVGDWFRFPVRLARAAGLGLGVTAALVAGVLAHRAPRRALLLLASAWVDAWVGTGALFASRPRPARLPAAYARAPAAPLLDLHPEAYGLPIDYDLEVHDLSCFFAALHLRPVAVRCLDTVAGADPAAPMRRWLHDALLRRVPPEEVRTGLAHLGIGSVAWWRDLYTAADRVAIAEALAAALGSPLAHSRDGGVEIVLHAVPGPLADRREALEALDRLQAGRMP